jgi:hypothetical protein
MGDPLYLLRVSADDPETKASVKAIVLEVDPRSRSIT